MGLGNASTSPLTRSAARDILAPGRWTGEAHFLVLQGPSIFTGNAHPDLASRICAYLEQPLGHAEVFSFSNENIFV